MNLPAALLAIRWLIWDTFRQSIASRIFQVMLAVTVLCVFLCLSTSTTRLPIKPVGTPAERISATQAKKIKGQKYPGVDVIDGEFTICFGAVRIP
jgi:hypothetical protein